MSQKIRIKLKSYDHNLVDKSAEKIVKTVKSTGGNGTLTIDVGAGYGLVMNNGGNLILGGGNISTPSYVVVRDNCELIVTAGTFYCGLEILNGHAGITGTVTVSDSGVIENFLNEDAKLKALKDAQRKKYKSKKTLQEEKIQRVRKNDKEAKIKLENRLENDLIQKKLKIRENQKKELSF